MKPAATFVAALLRQLRLLLQPPVALRIFALALLAAPTLLLLRLGAEGLLLAAAAGVAQGLYGAMFALDLMGRTAQGFARSAGQAAAGSHARLTRAAVLLIIGVAMVALVASSELLPLGMMPLWLLGVAIAALVLPVLVVKQALSDSLGAAAERGSLLEVAARLDRHLLVLAAAVLGAALLGAAVGLPMARAGGLWSLLREAASGRAAVAGAGALLLAFVLAAMHWSLCFLLCALMGRAMHARADALGIAVLGPGDAHDVVLRPVNLRKRLQDDAVERLVAEGDLRAAIKAVENELAEAPQSLALHARLHRLLKLEGYQPRIEDHAEKYLRLLVASNNMAEALTLADEALARNPQWQPREADVSVPLARAAFAADRTPLAAHLIRRFDRRHREHPDIPAAYLLGAQMLIRQGEAQQQQARAVLEHLAAGFPDSPEALAGRPLLDALEQWDRQRVAQAAVDRQGGSGALTGNADRTD